MHSLTLYWRSLNISNLIPGVDKALEDQIIDYANLNPFGLVLSMYVILIYIDFRFQL